MRTRDWRRHQSKRVKRNFLKGLLNYGYYGMDDDWVDWYHRQNYNNRKPCACWMCRNPRKYKELTLKEVKANIEYKEEINAG